METETNDIFPITPVPGTGSDTPIHPVSDDLRSTLAPASWCIYEWTTYTCAYDEADRVKLGSDWLDPILPGVFQFQFANRLGLTSITPYRGTQPLAPPLYLEVLARKFASPQQSVDFLKALLADLFSHVASLPFNPASGTNRRVRESHRPPDDLFVFHFFRHHARELVRGLQAILGRPHQVLDDISVMVRPHEVRRIEPEAMPGLLQSASTSRTLPGISIAASPTVRLRPEKIWQRLPVDTFDTPENRFILTACRRMALAIDRLQRRPWYRHPPIPESDRQQIDTASEALAMLLSDRRFAALEASNRIPGQSRVLQRRDGYREMTVLWHLFQRARQPVFEYLRHAIDLRDIATLYELWVLFELRTRIRAITGVEGTTSDDVDTFGAPGWTQRTIFTGYGTLHYNKTFTGYSGIPLRPDCTWELPNGDLIALDAKFRMTDLFDTANSEDDAETVTIKGAKVKNDDLQKMHTYRDAIPRVKAAIVLYPGTTSTFRHPDKNPQVVTLEDVVTGNIDGIGAIPLKPVSAPSTDAKST